MKKIFALIFSLTIFSAVSFAQFPSYHKNDISVSYGLFAPDQFFDLQSSMLDDNFPDKRYVRDNFSSMGNILLTYKHINRAETIFWGFSLGYGSNKSEVYYVGQYAGDLTRTFYSAGAEVQFRYVNRGIIQVYSGGALGFTFGQETLTASDYSTEEKSGSLYLPAYQLNVAGIRIGNKIAGFAEIGFGYKGIINAGISVQL